MCDVVVVVGVDAELMELSADDVTQLEERIVSRSRALLPAGSEDQIQQGLDDFNAILGRFHLQARLVVLERANSIVLFFLCMTLSALMSLRDQWRTRQLRDIVQKLLTFLAGNTQPGGSTRPVFVKRLVWPLADYERDLELFSSLQGSRLIYHLAIDSSSVKLS